jgi:glycosyltransferase involved in cell wall biosynthesis
MAPFGRYVRGDPVPTTQTEITLIICSFDRRESLLETLDTVAKQHCTTPWEVLVVDNNGTDGSAVAVSERAATFPVPLRVLREERQGRSYALNRAIESARGEILIFTDDDVSLRPGFVAGHAAVYSDARIGGAGGRILPVMPENTPGWMRELCENRSGGPAGRYDWGSEMRAIEEGGEIHLPYGANMSLRREIAANLGGFRTDLGWGTQLVPGEEIDMFERIRRAGSKVVYQPDAVVEHRFQPAKASLEYFLQFEAGCARSVVLTSAIAPVRRLRWIARSLLDFLYYSVKSTLGSQDIALRVENLRLRARARGSLAQLLHL